MEAEGKHLELSGNTLKVIAIIAMTIDHLACLRPDLHIGLELRSASCHPLGERLIEEIVLHVKKYAPKDLMR